MDVEAAQRLAAETHQASGAAAYGLSAAAWGEALAEVARKYPALGADDLHLEELALARACADGHEQAWRNFVGEYQPAVRHAALQLTHDLPAAEELAADVLEDLWGARQGTAKGRSKLVYYHGRGLLRGWLRTVVTQAFVAGRRRRKRSVSLEAEVEKGAQFAAPAAPAAAADEELDAAVGEALAGLASEDRCLLAFYYLDGMTLAAIARLLGRHESSVSRRVARVTRDARRAVITALGRRGWPRRKAEEALAAGAEGVETAGLRAHLVQETEPEAFSE